MVGLACPTELNTQSARPTAMGACPASIAAHCIALCDGGGGDDDDCVLAQTIVPGYGQSMDMYLEVVVNDARRVNTVQMILLIVEGVGICALMLVWNWMKLKDVEKLRYNIFYTFLVGGLSEVLKSYCAWDAGSFRSSMSCVDHAVVLHAACA